jgi:endonuclease/exonuclease/phosphatase family metal-dependent hydrolase
VGQPGVAGQPVQLRMLHWNIHSWRDDSGVPNHGAVAALIRETAPDVVSLVEVRESWGKPSQLAELSERLGYHWVFVPALEFGGVPPALGYGNALLTRLPIVAVQQWEIHSPGRYEGTEPSEPRTAACARVSLGGTRIWVISTHLPASNKGDRARALSRFAALVGKLDAPWLACGDFNTPASTWAGELPGATFCPDPPKPTHPARRARHPIDYGVASPGVDAEARVLRTAGSDHRPVLVTARFAEHPAPQPDEPGRGPGQRSGPGRRGRRVRLLPRRGALATLRAAGFAATRRCRAAALHRSPRR